MMQASITTSGLPVGGDGTYGQLVIRAVYTGDQTYAANDNINGSVNISSDVVTVFSSVALQDKENIENQVLDSISVDGNGNVTAWSEGSASGDGYDGIIISSKDLVSDGTNTTLTLHPIYTLDAIDREAAIPGYDGAEKLGELEDIYRLKLNVDYTVEWQYCSTYEAYEEFLSGSDEGMNWAAMDTSTSSDTCAIKQVYSYAFRAKITFLDTPKARAAYAEFDNYGAEAVDGERVLYSNILTVGDAEGRLFANIRKASSASANGDTVYIDALMMGGSTTPVGSLSVKVVDRFDNLVFEDTRNNVNGGTTFTWSGAEPGEYTITTSFSGNNGFKAEENVQQYIVRFTSADQTGEAGVPGVLSMGIHASPATYNGQAQMLDGGDVTISGFGDYTDWAAMAGEAVTFQYFDGEGDRVAEPTEAGTYSVKAYLPETMYWGYVEAWGTYTIEKRAVDIADVTAQAKTYDGVAGVNIQTIELGQSATDAATGLPSGKTGVVEGDSVYVTATGRLNAAAGGDQTLSLRNAALAGPDAGNYVIANTDYTESFTVSRSQLYGDAYDVITAAPGYRISDDDFYMIDQSGNQIGAARAQITYYYHSGNEIEAVDTTTAAGKYTVVIGMNETNYKGGLTLTLWIDPNAAQAVKEGSVERTAASALIDITDTNYVYDGQAHGVTAVATTGEAVTVEYAGADGNYSAVQPIDAGRYMVRAYTGTRANGELLNVAYGIMTIVKGEPQAMLTATDAVYSGHRYDGAPALAVETFNAGHDKLEHIYGGTYYTFVGGSITGYSYNAPRDVSYVADGAYDDSVTSGAYGTYVVTAHVPETANTVALTASAEYQITKAPLTIYGEDTYIELFDTQSKFTATYDGFVDGDYGADSELRDLIAMPTFRLGENSELSNDELSHVGYLTIHMSDVNARNYAVSYVDGEAAINNQAPWPALEIRGVPGTIYYGDEFQAFLYGSSGQLDGDGAVITNEASKVTWTSSDPTIAEVDAQGNITVKGVGEFTITGTRGDDPNTAISKSGTYTALPRRNDVVIAREDVPYNAGEQSIAEVNYSFYYMMHGTLFESQDPLSADHCTITGQPQSESGEYPVSASITGASKNVGDGRGLLAIHRVNSTVTPIAQTSVYGDVFTFPGRGEERYTAAPIVAGDSLADVLASGVVQADARYNSDVDGYEILVAGGTEGYNYNVSYAHYDAGMADNDYDITQRELTFTVGSLTDTEGATNQWREKNDNELAGLYTNLPEAAFENEGDRVFGERNQVLDYQIGGNGLIGGDSVADLWDTGRAQAEFAVLNVDYDLSAEAAANEKYNGGGKIASEHGTLDHQLIVPDPAIDEADYVITGQTNSRNYSVTVVNGRQDVTQRPVSIENVTVAVPAGTKAEDLMTIIGPQLKIEGLAANLEHDYRDLLLSVSGLNTSAGAGEQTVTLISANTNYYLDPNESTITVVIGNITANGEFIVKTPTRTVLQLQRTIAPEGASAYVEPAGGIADLRLTVTAVDPDSGKVLVPATAMTEMHEGDAGWDSSWDSSRYAYYELNHASLRGYLVRYGLEATGYIFYVQD